MESRFILNKNYLEFNLLYLGVILFILLSGVPPFYGNNDKDILDMIKKKKFSFDSKKANL